MSSDSQYKKIASVLPFRDLSYAFEPHVPHYSLAPRVPFIVRLFPFEMT
jgi:hypothetical protein